jgi:hypothetical protein
MLDSLATGLRSLVKPQYIFTFGLIYWLLLELIQQLYELSLPGYDIFAGFLAIALFALAVLFGASGDSNIVSRWSRRLAQAHLSLNHTFFATVACFILALTYYLFRSGWSFEALLSEALRGRGMLPWSRGAYGDTWAALEGLTYFSYIIPTLLILQIRISRTPLSPQILISAALAFSSLMLIAADGSRRTVGAAIISALVCWFLTADRGHPSLKTFLVAICLVLVVLLSLNLLLQTRGNWTRGLKIDAASYSAARVDDNFLRLCQTIEAVPTHAPYSGFSPVVFALVRPIPRVLWPGKPSGPGFTLHDYLGFRGVSLSISTVGELYTCFGFASVLAGGWLFGRLCRYWSKLLRYQGTLPVIGVYCAGYGTLFVGIRSTIDLAMLAYPLGAAWIVFRVIPRRKLRPTTPILHWHSAHHAHRPLTPVSSYPNRPAHMPRFFASCCC